MNDLYQQAIRQMRDNEAPHDLKVARELLQRSLDHLRWARGLDQGYLKEKEERERVTKFYGEADQFLKNTSPAPTK